MNCTKLLIKNLINHFNFHLDSLTFIGFFFLLILILLKPQIPAHNLNDYFSSKNLYNLLEKPFHFTCYIPNYKLMH